MPVTKRRSHISRSVRGIPHRVREHLVRRRQRKESLFREQMNFREIQSLAELDSIRREETRMAEETRRFAAWDAEVEKARVRREKAEARTFLAQKAREAHEREGLAERVYEINRRQKDREREYRRHSRGDSFDASDLRRYMNEEE